VDFRIAGHQAGAYQITTEVYEGPLDLLLQLIERAELDITKVALAQVTDQYLAYLESLQQRDAAEVSAFLVIAAKLVQIKSEALLPRPPDREQGEEDPGLALAQQLIIYRRYKRAAAWLYAREEAHLRTYLRLAPPPKVEGKVDLTGLTLIDLLQAALSVYALSREKPGINQVVTIPRVTILDKIRVIMQDLKERGHSTFRSLLGPDHNRIDMVVTFLALLELIKRHIVEARQGAIFADIEFQPIGEWTEGEDARLEFED
jgi:segregation and condensation protein A